MNRKNLRSLAAGVALLMAVGALAGCGGEKKADDSKKMVTVGIAQLVEHWMPPIKALWQVWRLKALKKMKM